MRALYLTHVAKGNKAQAAKLKLKIESPPRRKHIVFLGGAVRGAASNPASNPAHRRRPFAYPPPPLLRCPGGWFRCGAAAQEAPLIASRRWCARQVLAEIMKDKETFWMSRKEYDEMGIDALLALKCSM